MKSFLGQFKFSILAVIILLSAGFGFIIGRYTNLNINEPINLPQTPAPIPIPTTTQKSVNLPAKQEAVVTKVLDGDTVIITGGNHVRLLGIDADEVDYPCYQAAKSRLEELVLGKNVILETDQEDLDQYGRQLRYIFLNGENINEKLVSEGLAIARFYSENQKYKSEIIAAEIQAMQAKAGCKWSGIAR